MKKVIYIIILITAILFYPLYKDILSLIVLVTVILLPVATLAELIIRSKKIRIGGGFDGGTTVIYKGEKKDLPLLIKNDSLFPTGCAELCFETESKPFGRKETIVSEISVPSREVCSASAAVATAHCGTVDIKLSYIKVYDLLGLFSLKLFRDTYSASVSVIPKVSEEYEEEAKLLMSASDGGDGDMTPTTAPGDVIDFRDFRPGDRITLIHHKLSARFDKDIVKIMGASGEKRFILNADIDGVSPDDRDEIITHVISCAYYLSDMCAGAYVSAPDTLVQVTGSDYITAACALAPAPSVPQRTENGAVSITIGISQ
ncbi:MAG: DUF58 domain-containing protein [Oscillospiraceae bacterium]|nr:DUF58 domain-containing protein [Oscillospiraceae bacterium]